MAKITIAGEAVVVTSGVTLENWKKVEKYRPKALTLYGGEDGKEPIFGVGVSRSDCSGSVTTYGVEFAPTTHNAESFATVTMLFAGDAGSDIKEEVADRIGPAVLQLNKVEEAIPAVLTEIEAEKATIMESIVIA